MTDEELKAIDGRYEENRALYQGDDAAAFRQIGADIPPLLAEVRRLGDAKAALEKQLMALDAALSKDKGADEMFGEIAERLGYAKACRHPRQQRPGRSDESLPCAWPGCGAGVETRGDLFYLLSLVPPTIRWRADGMLDRNARPNMITLRRQRTDLDAADRAAAYWRWVPDEPRAAEGPRGVLALNGPHGRVEIELDESLVGYVVNWNGGLWPIQRLGSVTESLLEFIADQSARHPSPPITLLRASPELHRILRGDGGAFGRLQGLTSSAFIVDEVGPLPVCDHRNVRTVTSVDVSRTSALSIWRCADCNAELSLDTAGRIITASP